MIKNEISLVVSNTKFNMTSFKISWDTIEGFFLLIIDNKYAKNISILWFLFRVLANSKNVSSHSF